MRTPKSQTKEEFLGFVSSQLRNSIHVTRWKLGRRIFLCGANPKSGDGVRNRIADSLEAKNDWRGLARYSVYYPEELFDGLMSGPNRYDLLSLENLLAEAVDAVVLVVESAGAIAELGAFVNHAELRKKLVVIQDEKHRRAKSFISHGPIRLLQDLKSGAVLFLPLDSIEDHIEPIDKAVADILRDCPVEFDLSNVFHASSFIIPCLYILEQLTREELAILVAKAARIEDNKIQVVTSTAITVLLRERLIVREGGAFRLTENGARDFIRKGRWYDQALYSRQVMDELRIQILTRQRRRREH